MARGGPTFPRKTDGRAEKSAFIGGCRGGYRLLFVRARSWIFHLIRILRFLACDWPSLGSSVSDQIEATCMLIDPPLLVETMHEEWQAVLGLRNRSSDFFPPIRATDFPRFSSFSPSIDPDIIPISLGRVIDTFLQEVADRRRGRRRRREEEEGERIVGAKLNLLKAIRYR